MKLKLYAIHDAAVKEFLGPEPAKTHAEAERKFAFNVNREESGFLFSKPENFSLYFVGEYDTETGLLGAMREPQHIITAVQCKQQQGAN